MPDAHASVNRSDIVEVSISGLRPQREREYDRVMQKHARTVAVADRVSPCLILPPPPR